VIETALWHGVGKPHPAFQAAILEHPGEDVDRTRLWEKSPYADTRLRYGVVTDTGLQCRRGFRHELASMVAWLERGASGAARNGGSARDAEDADRAGNDGTPILDSDRVAYLIAAHPAKVRLMLRELPTAARPDNNRLYARGVWAGGELPAVHANGLHLEPLAVKLDVLQLGESTMGPSRTARTTALLERWDRSRSRGWKRWCG
jgi:CRISPR-associated endonuclease/helicase Cas3